MRFVVAFSRRPEIARLARAFRRFSPKAVRSRSSVRSRPSDGALREEDRRPIRAIRVARTPRREIADGNLSACVRACVRIIVARTFASAIGRRLEAGCWRRVDYERLLVVEAAFSPTRRDANARR